MSAIVKTVTPFTRKDILLESLDELGIEYEIQGQKIITHRQDYYGHQMFEQGDDNVFRFQHDSSADRANYRWSAINFKEWKTVTSFLEAVDDAYRNAYGRLIERLAEEERQREEERKRDYVEKVHQETIAKAQSLGYSVKENKQGNKVKLVLTRTIY